MEHRTIRTTPSPLLARTFLSRGARLSLLGAVTAGAVAGLLALACSPPTGQATSSSSDQHIEARGNLVISQVYPGSKGSKDDAFIELFNRGVGPVALRGLSVQIATAAGPFSAESAIQLETDAVVEPGAHFLVSLDPRSATIDAGRDTGVRAEPDASPGVEAAPDADAPREASEKVQVVIGSAGKIALTNAALDQCGGATDSAPCTGWLDLVSFGEASQFEGTAAMPPLTEGKAAYRKRGGCQDTNDNAEDFLLESPIPHGISSPRAVCGQDGHDGKNGTNGSDGIQGPKGDKGDAGATGAKGDTGATGPKGDKGDAGATGPKGDTGVAGAKGATGDTGVTGAKGATGGAGDKGATGAAGAAGGAGDKGAKGETGAAGSPGAQGARGGDGKDGGCSAAPNGTTSSPASAIVGVALTLAALRRRRKAS